MPDRDPLTALDGRVALVTGGSRGIGRAVVARLRELGARVASLDLVPPVADEPGADPDLHVACDLTDEAALDAAVARVRDELGPVEILVSNAGVNAYADAVELTSEAWDRFFALDLKATWLLARAVLPDMRTAGRGAIVSVASVHATLTLPGRFPYAAAKAGLLGLTRSLALDEAPRGITVNAVCPGLVATALTRDAIDRDPALDPDAVTAGLPMRRMGEPTEIAAVVAFLASDAARFVTGAAIPVDGGVGVLLGSL